MQDIHGPEIPCAIQQCRGQRVCGVNIDSDGECGKAGSESMEKRRKKKKRKKYDFKNRWCPSPKGFGFPSWFKAWYCQCWQEDPYGN